MHFTEFKKKHKIIDIQMHPWVVQSKYWMLRFFVKPGQCYLFAYVMSSFPSPSPKTTSFLGSSRCVKVEVLDQRKPILHRWKLRTIQKSQVLRWSLRPSYSFSLVYNTSQLTHHITQIRLPPRKRFMDWSCWCSWRHQVLSQPQKKWKKSGTSTGFTCRKAFREHLPIW